MKLVTFRNVDYFSHPADGMSKLGTFPAGRSFPIVDVFAVNGARWVFVADGKWCKLDPATCDLTGAPPAGVGILERIAAALKA